MDIVGERLVRNMEDRRTNEIYAAKIIHAHLLDHLQNMYAMIQLANSGLVRTLTTKRRCQVRMSICICL